MRTPDERDALPRTFVGLTFVTYRPALGPLGRLLFAVADTDAVYRLLDDGSPDQRLDGR